MKTSEHCGRKTGVQKERALKKHLRAGRTNKAKNLAKGMTQRPGWRSPKRQAWNCLFTRQDGRRMQILEGLVRGLVREQTTLLVVGGQKQTGVQGNYDVSVA